MGWNGKPLRYSTCGISWIFLGREYVPQSRKRFGISPGKLAINSWRTTGNGKFPRYAVPSLISPRAYCRTYEKKNWRRSPEPARAVNSNWRVCDEPDEPSTKEGKAGSVPIVDGEIRGTTWGWMVIMSWAWLCRYLSRTISSRFRERSNSTSQATL